MASYSEGARLGVPVGLAVKTGGPIVATAARLNGSTDANVRADLATLRSGPRPHRRLDRGRSDRRTRAERGGLPDRPSIRLLMSFDDLRPFIEPQARGEMANADRPRVPRPDAAGLPGGLARRAPRVSPAAGHTLHALARSEAPRARLQLGTVGQPELRIELEQRQQHESPRGDLRVGKGEALGAHLDVAEEQQVDVDRAGPVARAAEGAAVLGLDRLAEVEQLPRARARSGSGSRR